MNLNRGQLLSLGVAVLGVLVASTAQLNDLFGPGITKTIVSLSTLSMSIMSSINMALQGTSSQLAAVQDLPGVEKIVVNAKAGATLATMAVDPTNPKIEATAAATDAVTATAQAAS